MRKVFLRKHIASANDSRRMVCQHRFNRLFYVWPLSNLKSSLLTRKLPKLGPLKKDAAHFFSFVDAFNSVARVWITFAYLS